MLRTKNHYPLHQLGYITYNRGNVRKRERERRSPSQTAATQEQSFSHSNPMNAQQKKEVNAVEARPAQQANQAISWVSSRNSKRS